jgi:hypothetical protein
MGRAGPSVVVAVLLGVTASDADGNRTNVTRTLRVTR